MASTSSQQPVYIPVRVWTSSEVSTSYRLAARSQEAVTTCRPPTNQSAAITTPWWLFRVAVATRTVGTSQRPSPSTSPSSLSEESWSSSHGAYEWTKQKQLRQCIYTPAVMKINLVRIMCCNTPPISPWYSNNTSRRQYRATYTDIWWRLGGRKLHHVAPDVSRLVPGGWGDVKYTSMNRQRIILIYRKLSAGDNRGEQKKNSSPWKEFTY